MSDEFEKFYEDKEANEDSKSDTRVAFILVICFVAAALFLGFWAVIYSDKNFSASRAAIQPNPAEVIACL